MPDEIAEELKENGCRSISEYLLYKLDRSLAIIGIIAIAIVALFFVKTPENIVSAAIGGLVGYVGGRSK
jgi:hypothetical protein